MKNALMSETGNSQPRLTGASAESRGAHVRLMANLLEGTLVTGECEGRFSRRRHQEAHGAAGSGESTEVGVGTNGL